ncbi:N-acetyltransferase [Lutibacter sp. HS1-25]|uniref:GNAT family N-acetyltransferase n=1 Tax=Lutibacter sp. HS1-25 TaxID=2485000 RepID=UPI0010138F8A|nr:GNAT family N-acetyltransferase [Lutibacter sp. HS1-25]RXP61364.1 N-acetyltransferase [Lutibacter sp. HS1-25]
MEFVDINTSNFDQVSKIYWEGIQTGIATFETSVPTWETWNNSHFKFGRIALIENNLLLGWASLTPVTNRCVYAGVAEVSVYVAENSRGKGIGKKLLKKLIKISEENNIWTLQSGIMRKNEASIQMHLNCGFRLIGYREKIGKLNGEWLDNVILERRSKLIN